MITIVDYEIGNLRSVEKAFEHVGVEVLRTDDPERIRSAERLVLPGVGAFGACSTELLRRDLNAPVLEAVEQGVPLLGVCVGMQLLFDESLEMGVYEGLGLIRGQVVPFEPAAGLKVPHIGWNQIRPARPSPLLDGISDGAYVYFVHSYHGVAEQAADVLAECTYGAPFPAIVQRNNVFGLQFHPEKSGANGLRMLRNFATLVPASTAV
ncbi:MAG: imidazole glycerol phosphate synthase subunit HisH [Bacteroidota bacterium]